MSVKERDPLTGHQTTGHEWDGITELNTGVPRAVWFFIIVTHLWALIMWVLLPTWPLVTTYTKGILGVDQRKEVQQSVIDANLSRADWARQVEALPVDQIMADPDLASRVNTTGHQLFGDNCAACHGSDGAGGPGFPNLTDAAWLWGGDTDTIMETLRVGINSQHPDTRFAQMLAFGRDGILTRDEVRLLADHVQSLSSTQPDEQATAESTELFSANCSSCHGEDGTGNRDLGAPDLTDASWIYGRDDESLFTTIHDGRQGWMPAWEDRLSLTERKILTVYLQSLRQETVQ